MPQHRSVLLAALFLLLTAAAAQEGDSLLGDALRRDGGEDDEACEEGSSSGGEGGGACGLALHQLRAQASTVDVAGDSEAAVQQQRRQSASSPSSASGSCEAKTGGHCYIGDCDASRGEAECVKSFPHARCQCKQGYCAKNGYCAPDTKECIQNHTVRTCEDWRFKEGMTKPTHRESCSMVGTEWVVTCTSGACWIGGECRLK
mmetsp:Transcript_25613/g.64497  ORF Transcript_25613/g.64497 Transcript_25613/m.64497 type:complete len:203 (+) Transcript_25613:84-692(+)